MERIIASLTGTPKHTRRVGGGRAVKTQQTDGFSCETHSPNCLFNSLRLCGHETLKHKLSKRTEHRQ